MQLWDVQFGKGDSWADTRNPSTVQEALEWLQGGRCAREREDVLERALARGLQLLSARLQLGGQPAPLHAGPLIAPWAAIASDEGEPDEDSSASLRCPFIPCPAS